MCIDPCEIQFYLRHCEEGQKLHVSSLEHRRGVGLFKELKEPLDFWSLQSEQVWVRFNLALAGNDGEASLPPPPLIDTACTRASC
ncbi:hypothetical protein DY000_02032373 [Brassica cretica]|uniref:Uncharacterized protein n=1 Tax=Brassica cretica TaxID=69181 RepID=A0ABQ7E0F7_BRACR|nr:hypothetical protein DY000_02032373 [Brassica cretica]